MKILEEFWYGNILPNEREVAPGSRFAKLLWLVAKMQKLCLKNSKILWEIVNGCDSFVLAFV